MVTRPHLIVLLEESVLKCEAGNSATGQSGNQVDPNLTSVQNMRFCGTPQQQNTWWKDPKTNAAARVREGLNEEPVKGPDAKVAAVTAS